MELPAPREPDSERSHPTSEDLELSSYLEESLTPSPSSTADESPETRERGEGTARQTIVVVDFGSQYSMLIARRVRECHVYCELVPHDAPWEQVQRLNPRGFILSGGPASVYDEGAPQAPAYVFESGLPVLAICYGMQLLAHQLGGKVSPATHREYGHAVIRWAEGALTPGPSPVRGRGEDPARQGSSVDQLFEGLPPAIPVWMSHGDRITELPPGFRALAHSDSSPYAVMANDRGLIGLQFHPEVVHTSHGKQLLENFLLRVCGCRGDWTAGNFIADSILRIREQVGGGRVICALSGGVDSAVTAALIHRAIGDQLTCIFVNNGLLRREEPERVVDTFHRHLKLSLIHTDATDRFLDRLAGVTDPEEKRRIVGETFIRVFEEEADRLGAVDFIAQGTTYPDGSESGGGAPPAVLTDTRSVGVMGDYRTYGHVVAIRAVTAEDAMTADWARLPYDLLARIANRIVNEVPAVNRVVYDITSKPPGTIEWE